MTARHSGSGGVHHTTKQKGISRKGTGSGTYARKGKGRKAEHYDRPYLEGTYNKQLTVAEDGAKATPPRQHHKPGRNLKYLRGTGIAAA